MTEIYKKIACIGFGLLPFAAFAQHVAESEGQKEVNFSDTKFEVRGDSLYISFDAEINTNLKPHQSMSFLPTLQDDADNFATLPTLSFNGRYQQIAHERFNGKKRVIGIRRHNGSNQTYHYQTAVPFRDWMNGAYIDIMQEDCKCHRTLNPAPHYARLDRPQESVGLLPDNLIATMLPFKEEGVKNREYKGNALVTFVVNRWNLDNLYQDNLRELSKIEKAINIVREDPTLTFQELSLVGYASPEGAYAHNEMLSKNRLATLRDYIVDNYGIPAERITCSNIPENWGGLRDSVVNNTALPHRAEILAIIDSVGLEHDARDLAIQKEYPREYKYFLKHWYPRLRATTFCVKYVARAYSDDELAGVFATKPENLSLKEFATLAGMYPAGSTEYMQVIYKMLAYYPDDPVANYNAAAACIESHRFQAAERYLALAPNCPEKTLLKGIILLSKEDKSGIDLIRQAAAAGVPAADYYLKHLSINK